MTKNIATEQDAAIVLAGIACSFLSDIDGGKEILVYLVNSLGYHFEDYISAMDDATDNMENALVEDVLKRIISDTIGDVMAKSGKLN